MMTLGTPKVSIQGRCGRHIVQEVLTRAIHESFGTDGELGILMQQQSVERLARKMRVS